MTSGKSIGAGNEATIWTTGWRRRDQTGERPTRIPTGSVQATARASAAERPEERRPERGREDEPVVRRHGGEEPHELPRAEERPRRPRRRRGRRGARRARGRPRRRSRGRGLRRRGKRRGGRLRPPPALRRRRRRMAERRRRSSTHECASGSPETSAVRKRCDHATSGRQRSWSTATIMTVIARTAQAIAALSPFSIATAMYEPTPGQPEVAVAERERLVDGQEEPAARHRHHRVPDEADDGRRDLHRPEALPEREPVDPRDLVAARSGSSAATRCRRRSCSRPAP